MSSQTPDVTTLLSGDAARNYIRTNISGDTWANNSGSAVLRSLQAAGIGIRNQDFFAIRREILGLNRYEESIKSLRQDTLVPRAWMVDRPNIALSQQSQWRIQLNVFDSETGKPDTLFRAIATDNHYTPQESMEHMKQLIEGPLSRYGIIIDSMELFQVWTQQDAKLIR